MGNSSCKPFSSSTQGAGKLPAFVEAAWPQSLHKMSRLERQVAELGEQATISQDVLADHLGIPPVQLIPANDAGNSF